MKNEPEYGRNPRFIPVGVIRLLVLAAVWPVAATAQGQSSSEWVENFRARDADVAKVIMRGTFRYFEASSKREIDALRRDVELVQVEMRLPAAQQDPRQDYPELMRTLNERIETLQQVSGESLVALQRVEAWANGAEQRIRTRAFPPDSENFDGSPLWEHVTYVTENGDVYGVSGPGSIRKKNRRPSWLSFVPAAFGRGLGNLMPDGGSTINISTESGGWTHQIESGTDSPMRALVTLEPDMNNVWSQLRLTNSSHPDSYTIINCADFREVAPGVHVPFRRESHVYSQGTLKTRSVYELDAVGGCELNPRFPSDAFIPPAQ